MEDERQQNLIAVLRKATVKIGWARSRRWLFWLAVSYASIRLTTTEGHNLFEFFYFISGHQLTSVSGQWPHHID